MLINNKLNASLEQSDINGLVQFVKDRIRDRQINQGDDTVDYSLKDYENSYDIPEYLHFHITVDFFTYGDEILANIDAIECFYNDIECEIDNINNFTNSLNSIKL